MNNAEKREIVREAAKGYARDMREIASRHGGLLRFVGDNGGLYAAFADGLFYTATPEQIGLYAVEVANAVEDAVFLGAEWAPGVTHGTH